MGVTVTWEDIISLAALLAAVIAIVGYLRKVSKWFDRQAKQDEDIKSMKEELGIITTGLLAVERGLVELGCDGPVKEGIAALEKHLNERAHN